MVNRDKDIKFVKNVIIGLLIILSLIFAVSISTNDPTRLFLLIKAMGFFFVASIISLLIYTQKEYKFNLIGIKVKNAPLSAGIGIGAGLLFLAATTLVPGLSIGIPLVPNAIGDSLQFFIIVGLAPITEEIFFFSLFAYLMTLSPLKGKTFLNIFIVSFLFASFHLGAYISGLYDLPGFGAGFLGFSANLSVFLSAFLFRFLACIIVLNRKIQNLLASMLLHMTLNIAAYSHFAIAFA